MDDLRVARQRRVEPDRRETSEGRDAASDRRLRDPGEGRRAEGEKRAKARGDGRRRLGVAEHLERDAQRAVAIADERGGLRVVERRPARGEGCDLCVAVGPESMQRTNRFHELTPRGGRIGEDRA